MSMGNAEYFEMVLALGNKYRYDQLHARTVERLAVKIFEGLESIHKLGEKELNLLRHASLLHDLGAVVAIRRHHKHSAYLVSHDETLDGYPAKERELLASLVKNHRKKVQLEQEDISRYGREVLPVLIAILRIADVLDYFHRGSTVIKDISIAGDKCVFIVEGIDLEAIKDKVKKKAACFKEALDLRVVITSEYPEENTILDADCPEESLPVAEAAAAGDGIMTTDEENQESSAPAGVNARGENMEVAVEAEEQVAACGCFSCIDNGDAKG
jgi:exopolyphosphatase/guanosine-5'-triphosphate,3'-diphosphate pyrophosphatase